MPSHRHRVDHCGPIRSVENDELQQVAGSVVSEGQVAQRVVTDLVDDERMGDGVVDVGRSDPVAVPRRQDLHITISYYVIGVSSLPRLPTTRFVGSRSAALQGGGRFGGPLGVRPRVPMVSVDAVDRIEGSPAMSRTAVKNDRGTPVTARGDIARRMSPQNLPTRLWTHAETSEFLGIPPATLHDLNYKRTGPRSFKVGRHRRYDPQDVLAWLGERASDVDREQSARLTHRSPATRPSGRVRI